MLQLFHGLRGRLYLLFGLVLLGAIFHIAESLISNWNDLRSAQRNAAVVRTIGAVGDLLSSMQRERGLSAGFVAGKGGKFATALQAQRRSTDALLRTLRQTLRGQRGELPHSLTTGLEQALSARAAHAQRVKLIGVGVETVLALAVLAVAAIFTRALARLLRQLGADPEQLANIANAVADGDFTVDIRCADNDRHSVLALLRNMVVKLDAVVRSIQSTATELGSAAGEVSKTGPLTPPYV